MSTTSQHSHHVVRAIAPIAAALVIMVLGAMPSSARPDIGPPVPNVSHPGSCLLERVGTQFVRCDNLTGNGVPAPAFISER